MAELVEPDVFAFFQAEKNIQNLLLSAIRTGYPYFINYARLYLDLTNIKNFLRFKYRGDSLENLNKNLWPGGFLDVKIFMDNFTLDWFDLYPLLIKTDYRSLWEKSLLALEKKNTFIILERESENLIIHFWRRAKEITFGPEPVLAYAIARQREIDLLRLVIIGRMLDLPKELIKERLSETYV